jgi:hypothetical protein
VTGASGWTVRWRALALALTLAVLVAAMVALVARYRGRAQAPSGSARAPEHAGPPVAAPAGSDPMPFGRDETAAYRVTWRIGEGGGIAAGRATFGASTRSASRHFVLDVETAAWVASLFEARDRIETWTGVDLLPSRQEQHLREGRRVVDRATRFDRFRQTFSVDEGPPRALPRGARDGLSALFYGRTLPLAVAYATRFPVVEGGRIYEVDLRVDRVERIASGGHEVEAFKVTTRLVSLPDRRQAGLAMVWISTDRRRVPVVLDIETAFGSFRAELAGYERR